MTENVQCKEVWDVESDLCYYESNGGITPHDMSVYFSTQPLKLNLLLSFFRGATFWQVVKSNLLP